MTAVLAAVLLATLAASRPPGATPDPAPRKRAPIVAEAVAAALERKGRDIEIVIVGDVEDAAPRGSNVLELGEVSYRPESRTGERSEGRGARRATILRRMVTVRIGTARTGFAPLRASLQADDGRCRIRVDGKTLTAVPQMIDALAPLGQPVRHVIEIEIQATTAEGPVSASISWTSDVQ
jgi:hypothetical protein